MKENREHKKTPFINSLTAIGCYLLIISIFRPKLFKKYMSEAFGDPIDDMLGGAKGAISLLGGRDPFNNEKK